MNWWRFRCNQLHLKAALLVLRAGGCMGNVLNRKEISNRLFVCPDLEKSQDKNCYQNLKSKECMAVK